MCWGPILVRPRLTGIRGIKHGQAQTYVALKLCSFSMYCIMSRNFRRSRTYRRSISEYAAAHSLCVGTGCGTGTRRSTGRPGRGTSSGRVIVMSKEKHHQSECIEPFLWLKLKARNGNEEVRRLKIYPGHWFVAPQGHAVPASRPPIGMSEKAPCRTSADL